MVKNPKTIDQGMVFLQLELGAYHMSTKQKEVSTTCELSPIAKRIPRRFHNIRSVAASMVGTSLRSVCSLSRSFRRPSRAFLDREDHQSSNLGVLRLATRFIGYIRMRAATDNASAQPAESCGSQFIFLCSPLLGWNLCPSQRTELPYPWIDRQMADRTRPR
jgi:hypothetical protein